MNYFHSKSLHKPLLDIAGKYPVLANIHQQNAADNNSLIPMVDEAERQSGTKAEKILADAGFLSLENVEELESRCLDVSFDHWQGVPSGLKKAATEHSSDSTRIQASRLAAPESVIVYAQVAACKDLEARTMQIPEGRGVQTRRCDRERSASFPESRRMISIVLMGIVPSHAHLLKF